MTYRLKTITSVGAVLGVAFLAAASAQGYQDPEASELTDAMTRAEKQCVALKKAAEGGTEEDKNFAEKKCLDAIKWAKEMMAKNPKDKPKPNVS